MTSEGSGSRAGGLLSPPFVLVPWGPMSPSVGGGLPHLWMGGSLPKVSTGRVCGLLGRSPRRAPVRVTPKRSGGGVDLRAAMGGGEERSVSGPASKTWQPPEGRGARKNGVEKDRVKRQE